MLNRILQRVKFQLKFIRAHFNSKLPVGVKEFKAYASEIIELSRLDADYTSMEETIAKIVPGIKFDKDAVPKMYFVKCVRKHAANIIATTTALQIQLERKEAAECARAEAEVMAKNLQSEVNLRPVTDVSAE